MPKTKLVKGVPPSQIKIQIPIVIRLSGTNSKEGLEILKSANLPTVETMSEAAEKAIALSVDFLR